MERTMTSYVKKWLGVPRCLTNISLYGKGVLELPITSLTEEYKCSKVRLQMTLKDSRDQTISNAVPPLLTGWKWTPSDTVQQATSALRNSDIVGHVQLGRGGFGLTASKPTWHKASTSERRNIVVEEVRRQEETERSAKAVSLPKQGQRISREGLERRKLSWRELCEMEASNISFIIRATYDVLPSPKNLHSGMARTQPVPSAQLQRLSNTSWPVVRPASHKAATPAATTRSSRVWQQLLRTRGLHPTPCPWEQPITSWPNHPPTKPESGQLAMARDWKMLVDIG